MSAAPFIAIWDGAVLIPLARHITALDASLVIGESYRVELTEERSARSHNHYFAALHNIWLNLPDNQIERFPTEESLRKFSLVKTGYCERADVVCANNREAMKYAAVIARLDPYTVVSITDRTVSSWTAKTQSKKAMGADEFQASKQAVLDYCASLIGVKSDEVETEGNVV